MVETQGLLHRHLGFTPWTLDSDPNRIQHFLYPELMHCVSLTCEQCVQDHTPLFLLSRLTTASSWLLHVQLYLHMQTHDWPLQV